MESTICLAPILRRISACSALRTMLTRPMPSLRQILLSIWPRLEAAAVCTSALWPSRRMVSVMPSAVSGLTKQEAPSAGVVPAGSTRQSCRLAGSDIAHTSRRRSSRPSCPSAPSPRRDDPVLIDHAGALIADRHRFIEPAGHRPASPASGTFAVMTGASLVPDALAVAISAAPIRRPRSDGLIGVASTRTTTSSGRRLGRRHAQQRNFEFAALLDQRTQLQARCRRRQPCRSSLFWFVCVSSSCG